MASAQRAIDDARARGLPIEVVPRPLARSLAEAAAGLGIEARDLVKTIVVRRSDDDFLFVLVPGDRQISWPKLRACAGANRLSMPDAQVAFAATGYERGTITPLGSTKAWPVFADERISGRIALGSGEHDLAVFVDATRMLQTYGATTADLSETP
ncbi:MAG: Cys-tRNA(Pro)/Cys-tRNA(Cys) deacylase [Actinomycetota bacterium]|nr:Cys-tRNA(Pro)/Cys-tRNA(Cys) deacylase [Actinomycetota bacterium]